jgi:DNA-binding HxlR family transcriptional regulator
MRKHLQNPDNCALVRAMGYIGGKWKLIILIRILAGVKIRFGKLAVQMPDISRKILSQHLKELEEDGLIFRHSYMEKPPRVEYELSPLGKTLIPVLKALHDWGAQMEDPATRSTWNPVVV